jgi:hypothetical protein
VRGRTTQALVKWGGCEKGGNSNEPVMFCLLPMKETAFPTAETRFCRHLTSFAYIRDRAEYWSATPFEILFIQQIPQVVTPP